MELEMEEQQPVICSSEVPILYYDELCPQSRSCYMLAKMLEIEVDLKPSNITQGKEVCESLKKLNPLLYLPTLADGQMVLSGSHTILIYLCDKYAGENFKNLCPRDEMARLNVLDMLFLEGSVLYPSYNNLMMEISIKKYSKIDINYHRTKTIEAYNLLNSKLKGQLCMAGNELTIADISIVTTLSSLDLIFPIDQTQWPNIYECFENIKTMETYKSNEEGLYKLGRLLQEHGEFPVATKPTSAANKTIALTMQDEGGDKPKVEKLNSKSSLRQKFVKLFFNSRERLPTAADGLNQEATKTHNEDLPTTEYPSYSKSHEKMRTESELKQEQATTSILREIVSESDQKLKKQREEEEDEEAYTSLLPRIRTFQYSRIPSSNRSQGSPKRPDKEPYEQPETKEPNFVKRSDQIEEIEMQMHSQPPAENTDMTKGYVEIVQERIPCADC